MVVEGEIQINTIKISNFEIQVSKNYYEFSNLIRSVQRHCWLRDESRLADQRLLLER